MVSAAIVAAIRQVPDELAVIVAVADAVTTPAGEVMLTPLGGETRVKV